MARNEGTEKATPQKKRKQREKGNLSKSTDLTNFLTLLAMGMVVFLYAKPFTLKMVDMLRQLFELIEQQAEVKEILSYGFKTIGEILLPVVLIGTIFHVINYVMQVGFLFSPKIIVPDIKRINPVNYFKNLFSRKTIVELGKSFLKLFILGYAAFLILQINIEKVASTFWMTWFGSVGTIYGVFKMVFGGMLAVLAIISSIDFVYQKWEYAQSIKMKKEEVKREHRDNEGDPRMKIRMKQFMLSMMEQDVAKSVPESTFILNNPTHISVAIRYDVTRDDIPMVVAKGEDSLALHIRSLAEKHQIPMVENIPLAREIYYNVEVGDPIQEEVFEAVIEVLKYLITTEKIENNFS